MVHLLGDAGTGKTTLVESLQLSRSYFSSWLNVSPARFTIEHGDLLDR